MTDKIFNDDEIIYTSFDINLNNTYHTYCNTGKCYKILMMYDWNQSTPNDRRFFTPIEREGNTSLEK